MRGRNEIATLVVEGINGVMKRGPMAVTPAMSIATTTKRLIDAATIKGDVRLQSSAKQDQAIPLWTKLPTVGKLTDLAEGIVSQNLQRKVLYNAVQGKCRTDSGDVYACRTLLSMTRIPFLLLIQFTVDDTTWWVHHAKNAVPNESLPSCTIPKFNRVRVVTKLQGKFLRCSCGFFSRHDLPCSHVLCITDSLTTQMCGLQWWTAYDRHFLMDESITKKMLPVISCHPPGVPVGGTKTYDHYPHLLANTTSEAYELMVKIINSSLPVVYGDVISCSIAEEEEDYTGTYCLAWDKDWHKFF
ncbi:MAG: SWIM zinc finger family protein [Gaiellaceae bacterium]